MAERASLAEVLGALQRDAAPGRTEPSELRRCIRDNFDAITAARGRGVSWGAIAKAMGEAGVRAPDGTEVGWRALKSLFHAERYAREEKRKPRRRKAEPA
jgi:hypothetical protein